MPLASRLGFQIGVSDWGFRLGFQVFAESTRAGHKPCPELSNLSLRSIGYRKEKRGLGHIFVCFMTYVRWKSMGQLCIRAGLGNELR